MSILNSHILGLFYKHIVPTGLKKGLLTFFYKHIVPMGLKRVQDKEIWSKPLVYVKQCLTNSYLAQLVNISIF